MESSPHPDVAFCDQAIYLRDTTGLTLLCYRHLTSKSKGKGWKRKMVPGERVEREGILGVIVTLLPFPRH